MGIAIYRVKGNSMNPSLWPDDLVVISKWLTVKIGDIVVLNTEDNGPVIKRVVDLSEGEICIASDNLRLGSSCCNRKHQSDKIKGKLLFVIPYRWSNLKDLIDKVSRYLRKILFGKTSTN